MLWGDWVEIPKDLFTLPPFKTKLFGVRAPHTIEEDEAIAKADTMPFNVLFAVI